MMTTNLRQECDELLALATAGTNPDARRRVLQALSSKWDGVRVTACRVLLGWADEESVTRVRELLADLAQDPLRWATTGAIARRFAAHLKLTDLEWAVDLFLHRSHADNRFVLASFLEVFPPEVVLSRLTEESTTTRGKAARDLQNAIGRAKARLRIQRENQVRERKRPKRDVR